jgi:hypothetical protein
VGEWFADVIVVNRVPHGFGGIMVWAGISYGQRIQLHFIDGNMNAQRCSDEILRPMSCHSSGAITSFFSMTMHSPMSQGSVHNSWKLKRSQFFHGLHTQQTCHPLSMFGRLWIDATSHSHWKGVGKHPTSHNRQPDQL